ncbi:MAG: integrase [Rhodobacterales bacterium]|nr:MAG: integrase [Rhodobacterales bacterium]
MPKQATPLTATKVRTLGAGQYADGHGLYLVVGDSGARRWIARVQVKGMVTSSGAPKRMEIGLGNAIEVPLPEAREEALRLKRLAKQGINPLQEEIREVPSFEELAREWIASNETGWTNAKHRQQWTNTLQDYAFPQIGGMRVDQIEQQHVLSCIEPIWNEKRETARRVMQRIAKILDVARAKQYRTGENPVEIIKRANVLQRGTASVAVSHHSSLQWAELPAFWSELIERDGTAAIALQFTILTAARTSETLGAVWSEIDLEARTWSIPALRMKANKAHTVPLCDGAMALLTRLHNTRRCDLIFEGQKAGKPLSNMTMASVLKRMGRTGITVHGFRSTFRDWCGDNSVDREIAELSLAHAIGNAVEQSYSRSDLLSRRREVMEQWGRYVKGEVS